jgi:Photosynthesis affected mutant 68
MSGDWRLRGDRGRMQVGLKIDLPMGTVFIVQSFVFGAGLLGITYGATSASWDPAREGSRLGWAEFQANFAAIRGKIGQDD